MARPEGSGRRIPHPHSLSRMTLSSTALQLLDAIEAAEMRSLEWGYVEGSLSESDLLSLPDAPSPARAIEDAAEELIEARAIFEISSPSGGIRIRSRFAELLRLLATNRQLFPGKPWQGAPHLVSDFRVDRRPRRFPRRDREPTSLFEAYPQVLGSSPLRTALWHGLTGRPGMRLAGFQERATIRLAEANDDAGTIVTAGTGSGKTLAFYLPAMMRIGEAVTQDSWVKALAIYPRIELLKDQFGEAFKMARQIDGPLSSAGRRPLVLGALYGATPAKASTAELTDRGWPRHGNDFVCPWIRCPQCGGDLVWNAVDIAEGSERLHCARRECDAVISSNEIVLTRRRMQQAPPDLLFTTTEILNQRLSDHWMRGLFGVGGAAGRRPFLALLDEVHTYEGASGAQAALTLRRWRHLLGSPVSWVGLSATLGDAARFFSDLTGAHPDRVVEITPAPEEIIEEGAEYQILLRGDAGSRTSLLSTTIQSAILLPRLLDPPGAAAVSWAFGRRAFLFTDDLDVTNRLFDDLRDAEGYTIFGQVDPQRRPLAALRANGSDAVLRDLEGQRWRACEDIGHPLDRPLVVGRTTSQDGGVNASANVVVATSTLEVGFNDPFVGAVIQHKAPRGMASFLQRKGRAGRDRRMRPIMLTVLSDYGRDRAFYQGYEHLFDPHLDPQHLPVRNPYVLRIQSVFALFDWLAARSGGPDKAWIWDFLSRPRPDASAPLERVIQKCRTLLSKLVEGDPTTLSDLSTYLSNALSLDESGVESLLWEAPRSLLLEAVPTLLRRLVLQWHLALPAQGATHDVQIDYHPLPDFVPRTLFSDLSLPEVRIITPAATVNHEEREDALPIVQALGQLAPGRVTRRFAYERGGLSHWSPVDPALPEQSIAIGDYAEQYEFVGSFRATLNEADGEDIRVYRPWTIRLEKADRSIALPSSNSRLSWRSDLGANGDPVTIPISPRSSWQSIVDKVDFHLHRFRASVSVRRFAAQANAVVRTLTDDFPVTVTFEDNEGRPSALGFEIEVDGFRLDLKRDAVAGISASPLSPALNHSARLAYLKDRFRRDPGLPTDLNDFQRDWLFQILISALLADAFSSGRGLGDSAAEILRDDNLSQTFSSVMRTLFGAASPEDLREGDEDDNDDNEAESSPERQGHPMHGAPSRLQQALEAHIADPLVRDRLRGLAEEAVDPQQDTFSAWLDAMVLDTFGEAMLQACIASAPRQATLDNLLIDLRTSPEAGSSVWITESTLGGAGVLEAFAERFSAEPRLFFAAVEAALAPTDLEMVDGGLRQILQAAGSDTVVADLMAALRATSSHAERAAHWRALSAHLGRSGGVDLSHALSVAVNARLLRSGSGPNLDALLIRLLAAWDTVEDRFGLAVGLREFAFLCSRDPDLSSDIRTFLGGNLPAGAAAQTTIMSAVTNLLWAREAEVRSRALQSYNPYRGPRATDPGIVRHLLARQDAPPILFGSPDWRESLALALQTHGVARLAADAGSAGDLRAAIIRLLASPIDVGVLQFFPTIERIDRSVGRVTATLTLREQL